MNRQQYSNYAGAALILIFSATMIASGCGGSSHSSSSPSVVNQTQTLSNIRILGLALVQYEEDYDETLPNVTTAAAIKPLLMPYTHDSSVFVDANNNVPFDWNASLAAVSLATIYAPESEITFYDQQPPIPNAIPVGFLDGHTEFETLANFNQLKVTSGIP